MEKLKTYLESGSQILQVLSTLTTLVRALPQVFSRQVQPQYERFLVRYSYYGLFEGTTGR